jgi:hypothetical protein
MNSSFALTGKKITSARLKGLIQSCWKLPRFASRGGVGVGRARLKQNSATMGNGAQEDCSRSTYLPRMKRKSSSVLMYLLLGLTALAQTNTNREVDSLHNAQHISVSVPALSTNNSAEELPITRTPVVLQIERSGKLMFVAFKLSGPE